MKQSTKTVSLAAAALFCLVAVASVHVLPASASTSSSTGVIVPLYFYPNSDWNTLIQQKAAHPNVPFIAVINPANGPGGYDAYYVSAVNNLKSAGIVVVGYVYTQYAARSLAAVENDALGYKNIYGISGIFVDQMSNIPGYESYYSSLNNYAKSIGLPLTIGNPGTSVPSSYIGTADNIIIYESPGLPDLSMVAARTQGNSRTGWSIMSYAVGSVDTSYINSVSNYVSYLYLTNGVWPAPYSSVAGYLSTLVSTVDTGFAPSTPLPGSGTGTLTVNSVDQSGSTLSGMWTVIQSGGNTVASGYTPLSFTGLVGSTYTVSMSDYGSYTFNHWDDSTTSNSRAIALTQATSITAYYSASAIPSAAFTPSTIRILSADLSGDPINGLWTVVQSGGATSTTGFTPLTFSSSSGAQYTVSVSNYGSYTFDHWSTGNTSPSIAVSGASTLTAYYRTSGTGQATLTIQSLDHSGNPLSGMWTVVSSGDAVVASGYTPLTFNGVSGQQYTVTMSNYGSYYFSYWEDGSTSNTRSLALAQSTVLTAHY